MFVYDKGLDSPGEANKTVEHTRATTSKKKKELTKNLETIFLYVAIYQSAMAYKSENVCYDLFGTFRIHSYNDIICYMTDC